MLTFRYTDKQFDLQGVFLKMITNKNYKVDLAKFSDKKLLYDFAKEMYFDEKTPVKKSTRDRSLSILLKSPNIMVFASGVGSSHQKNLSRKQDFILLILMNFVIC